MSQVNDNANNTENESLVAENANNTTKSSDDVVETERSSSVQIYGLQCASFVSEVTEAIHVIFIEYKEQYNQNIANQASQESREGDAPCDEEILADNEFLSRYNQFLSQQNLQESKSELERYLDESVVPLNQKSFDILKWWSDNSLVYPTLSKIARDYLAIPASTVASKAAFSNGGRVLDQYRSRLTPDIVEVLICYEDWLREEDHIQGDGERKKMEVACDPIIHMHSLQEVKDM
ncbi:hypothetical protein Taro_038478 [Colocasia esculenta]|uniref:HAT C-terminal dimerisation domain-containing protein n=1 Tax=Colocasia esculenta TaxID=4460 RepID=A0A843WMC7_COLES|nr:hypothetical protein [Colocasia esculenta]